MTHAAERPLAPDADPQPDAPETPAAASPAASRAATPGTEARRASATPPSATASPAATPPSAVDVAWVAAIALAKATVVALAVDAFVNSDTPRFSGKGMKLRAIGYTASLLVVPALWRARGRRDPYPRALDLAVTLPLLADAGGNAVGIYQRAHVDDAIHFAHGAILTSVLGTVISPRTRTSWEAAAATAAAGTAAAAVWEILEWTGMKLGAKGMNLTYDDTMEDLIESTGGALLGALVTLLRHPARLRQVPGRGDDRLLAGGS